MLEKQKDSPKQTKISTASVLKLKQRLRVFVWSVFIVSALAVVATSYVLPKITQPMSFTDFEFVKGEARYAATSGEYQTTNSPLFLSDFTLTESAEMIPLFNAVRITGEIGHVYSPVYDMTANNDPTGLYKAALSQRRVSEGNNYVAFMLRGAPEPFTADSSLEWHKREITPQGNSFVIIDQIPTTVTANWKYFQMGLEIRRVASAQSPQVGSLVMQTVSYTAAVAEGQCPNGQIAP
ncbi:MAG: hypothetical protein ACD_68C00106G0001, partial [uncultured bacterium]